MACKNCGDVILEVCRADRKYSSVQMAGLIESDVFGRDLNKLLAGVVGGFTPKHV